MCQREVRPSTSDMPTASVHWSSVATAHCSYRSASGHRLPDASRLARCAYSWLVIRA